jgi:DNA-binding response OmpR family regulator
MKKILIIDDDPSTTESIGSYLKDVGYEVATASDGLEGLELVKKFDPDLVISDIRMPKLNGLELYSVLKGMKFTKPIILISAFDYADTSPEKLKITAFIEKPINIFALNDFIKQALFQKDITTFSIK